jgi:hypothetical protein
MSIPIINFIGIGAQKSGTSWLFNQFGKSDQINLTPIKELHYFDRSDAYNSSDFLAETKLSKRLYNLKWTAKALIEIKKNKQNRQWYKKWFFSDFTDQWYLSLFANLTKCKGEITPAYAILKEEDIARMSQLLGQETKIIFMLRHPAERAWSSYKYINRLKNYVSDDFEHAKAYMYSDYQIARTQYLKTIQLYKKYFNSVFVGFFDAIVDKPDELLLDIFNYLELDTKEIKSFEGLNKKVNTSKSINMPNDIHALLNEIYKDDIKELSEVYGEYFLKWKESEHFIGKINNFKPSFIIK